MLQSFINSLPGFYRGSETISEDLSPSMNQEKDNYLVRVDGSERVLTGEQNKLIGNYSNIELATLAAQHRTGNLAPSITTVDLTPINEGLKEVKASIENKPVYLGRDFDATAGAITEVIVSKNKIERNHIKLKIQG